MTTLHRIRGPAVFGRLRTSALVIGVFVAYGPIGVSECSAQLCGQLSGLNHSQDFNTLAVSGSSNISTPIGFAFSESGTGNNITYAASDGSLSTNNTYSYGTTSNTDRALGELTGGAFQSTVGACFVNNSDHAITSFIVSYTGEQWRLGAADGNTDRLDFQYSTDATTLNTGTWIDVNVLDFVGPTTAGSVGAKNGNAAANRTVFAPLAITPAVAIQPEKVFFIRWVPSDIAGEDDGLAIDNFTLGTTLAFGLAGDYNNNGTVDAADYLVWRKFLNQAVAIPNDITPGIVTTQDFLEWKQRFGKVNPPPGAGAGGGEAAVPEPATLFLLGVAVAGIRFRRRAIFHHRGHEDHGDVVKCG